MWHYTLTLILYAYQLHPSLQEFACNITNCAECDIYYACTICDDGYYSFLGGCATCTSMKGCDICSSNETYNGCDTCLPGYYLEDTICQPCVSQCTNCTSATDCYACGEGLAVTDDSDYPNQKACGCGETEVWITDWCEPLGIAIILDVVVLVFLCIFAAMFCGGAAKGGRYILVRVND